MIRHSPERSKTAGAAASAARPKDAAIIAEGRPFVPLGQYEWPSLPTEDRLRLVLRRIRAELLSGSDADAPAVAADRLEGVAAARLDRIAAPPACGPLLQDLALTLQPWLDGPDANGRMRLIVLPPGDGSDILQDWADARGLSCLDAPPRDDLAGETVPPAPDLEGEGVLVIPNLERWFLRHHNGLRAVRMLMTALSSTQRRCVIGCNSWAWAYLSSAIDAQLQLPAGLTFQAFDAGRLHAWFRDLASRPAIDAASFRISGSGKDVFALTEEGAPESDFFQKLAARSLGIPWVAWSLWRRSFRETRETEDGGKAPEAATGEAGRGEVIWIAGAEEFTLPADYRQSALLVLQSLLIHGPLTAEHLGLTLPFVGQKNMVEALMRAGFLRQRDGRLSCEPAAYPAIRRELANAGYSMDRL